MYSEGTEEGAGVSGGNGVALTEFLHKDTHIH